MNIEGQHIEAYKNFAVPLDNNKLNLPMRNNSVTANKNKNIARDDLDDEKQIRIQNDQVIRKKNQRRN